MEIIYISLDKIFPPKPKAKELSNNLLGQIFVPVVDDETNIQTGDGFCLNRRQLLSVTYLREITDGEHEPIYTVVQQAMIYYLNPFGSNFELQICLLSKTDDEEEHIKIDDILYFDDDLKILSGKEDEVMKRTYDTTMNNIENYAIEAQPLSVAVATPSNPTTIVMQNSKRWRAPRPYMMRERKNTSAAEKVAKLGNVHWLKDWVIEARQRKCGRYDYFYYHKRIKLMCRSLVEVHNFHSYGVLPRRGVKTPIRRPIIQDDASTVNQNVNEAVANPVPPEPEPEPELQPEPEPKRVMKKKTPSNKKRTLNDYSSSSSSSSSAQSVSEMLKEAYDNLLMSNSPGSSTTFVQTCSNDDDNNQPQPPISVEDFLRDSYNNLNNTPPNNNPNSSESTPFMNKKYVEDFLKDSYNNLLNSTPMPKSSKGYNKKRKVAEKMTEEGTGHENV